MEPETGWFYLRYHDFVKQILLFMKKEKRIASLLKTFYPRVFRLKMTISEIGVRFLYLQYCINPSTREDRQKSTRRGLIDEGGQHFEL